MNWYGGYASTVINEETNAGLGIALVSALKKQRYAIRTLEDENKRIFAKLVEFDISTY